MMETFTKLLKDICSNEQMELCQKLGILSKSEQLELFQLENTFLDNKDCYTHIITWIQTLKDRYTTQLKSQSITEMHRNSDLDRIQYLDQVHYLSSLLEQFGEAHQEMSELLQSLRKLRLDWRHKRKDIENIILSILSSSPQYRVVKMTKSNLSMLGLGLSSIGKHYIVFEDSSKSDRKDIINQLAQDFSFIFQQNAQQNLSHMADTFPHVFQDQETDILQELNTLSQKLYSSSFTTTTTTTSNNKSSARTLLTMSKPNFSPSESDWSHILKYKRPTISSRGRSGNWCARPHRQDGLWCTSISSLADQFTQVAESYYANMLNNARTVFTENNHTYESATDSLLKIYRAIQLEKGCANLSKSLILLYKLQNQKRFNTL